MSKEVKIFVGERQLDLYDGVSIPLNFNISDVSNIDKRAGSFSRTIKIPATQNNDIIMGFGNNIKSRFREEGEGIEEGALTQILKETARVEANGLTIFTGFIKPLGATLNKDGCYSEYSINIFADNNDWSFTAKDRKLSEMNWTAFNHTFDKATIDSKEALGNASNVLYPLVNYGKFSRNGGKGVAVEDRNPAWSVREVLKTIFSDQNYTIESTFIDTDFFKNLYVPVGGRFELTDIEADSLRFRSRLFHPASFLESDKGRGDYKNFPLGTFNLADTSGDGATNLNLSTAEYTVPFDSIQKFYWKIPEIEFFSDPIPGLWRTKMRLHIFHRPIATGIAVSIKTINIDELNDGSVFNVELAANTQTFRAGDKVFLGFELLGNISSRNRVRFNGNGSDRITFYNEISKVIPVGTDLEFDKFVPDITQLEFIQALTHMFNLYFYADVNTRKIYIEPRDDFYFNATTALDWSSKLDNNKNCEVKYLGDNLKKNIRYRYKEDSNDKYVDYWEFETNRVLASEIDTLENKFTSGNEDKVNKIFAPTLMDYEPRIGFDETKLPKIWNDVPEGRDAANKSTDFEMRILHFGGVVATNNDAWDWDGTTRFDYPKFTFVDDTTVNTDSLHFDDQIGAVGLFKKHYKNTHRLINFGRAVELHLNLTDVDITNFDFRNIVHIDGCYYYVEEIKDYDTTVKQTTKVRLLTLVDLEPQGASENENEYPILSTLFGNFRRGNTRLRSDFNNNIIGGLNNDTNGFEETLLLGTDLTATRDRQTIIGNSRVSSDSISSETVLAFTGVIDSCVDGEDESRVLMQFDADGNIIVGGGEIYTSCGNRILFNNDVCDLKPIYKDNINS